MQAIYNYISETNHVSTVYNFAAILCLHIMIQIMLFPMMYVLYLAISAFRSMCLVTNMAVLYIVLTLCFPGTLLRYFLNNFDIVPVVHIIIYFLISRDVYNSSVFSTVL